MEKDSMIWLRVSEIEKGIITANARQAKMTVSNYLRTAGTGKKIVVIEGLPELNRQLIRVGTNLNQLTMLCHKGLNQNLKIQEAALTAVGKVVNDIWQLLSSSINQAKQSPQSKK